MLSCSNKQFPLFNGATEINYEDYNIFLKNKNNHIVKKTKSILFSLTGNKTIAILKMKNETKNLSTIHTKKENLLKTKTQTYNKNYPTNQNIIK